MGLKDILFRNGDADWQEIKAAFSEAKKATSEAVKEGKAAYEAATPFNGEPVVTVTTTGLRTLSDWDREAAKHGYFRAAVGDQVIGLRTLTYRRA